MDKGINTMSKVENGQTVKIHYTGKFDDDTEFDNSRSRGEALTFQVGSGQLITGFDNAVVGMAIGEVKNVSLTPLEAYGESREELVQTISQSVFPQDYEFQVDSTVQGQNELGQDVVARIDSVGEDSVVLDFNHPMAGKNLNFEIELLSVEQA
jgi:FKBP-type peptidyl-prolyl cis-trans isomerase 2